MKSSNMTSVFVFLELFAIATMINISFCSASGGCIESEREALLKLKQDLIDPSNRLVSWNISDGVGDCCKWAGVVCNNFTGHVFHLNLGNPITDLVSYDEYAGYYSYDEYETDYKRYERSMLVADYRRSKLVGKINPSLVDLKHLIHLDFSGNDFQGIPIPKYLGSLENLRYLNLSGAGFSGRIPHQLGNLSNLQHLDLGQNYHYYGLHVDSFSWLSGLSLIKHLDMSEVNLSEASGWLLVTNSLPSLKVLKLSSCQLPHLPPLSSANFSSLNVLDLSSNHFEGPIPHVFGNLTSLRYLDLSWNQFNSTTPGWLSKLNHLEFLSVGGNQLQGTISSIGLENLTSLRHLDLSPNQFNSTTRDWLSKLNHLEFLSLRHNELQGTISSIGLENLTSLRHLDLSWNQFNSTTPGWLSKLNHLEFLSVGGNKFQGMISSIGLENLTDSIKTLDLSWNEQLGGKIPTSFARLCMLTSIDISHVKLSQDISQVLDIFSPCASYTLESLSLKSCQISGHLTNHLERFKNLQTLDLSDNSISGPLPPPLALGQLSQLEFLDLSNNKLNGTLSEIYFVNLTKLLSFSVSGNSLIFNVNPNWLPPFQLSSIRLRSCKLGPQFPSWLHSQKQLSDLDISNTGITDTIPHWFWNSVSQYGYLNLSSNQIYGEIPDVDGSWISLDLSNNALSGSIFRLICNVGKSKSNNTVYLILSKNNFSEEIPDCWMNWPGLFMLNLGNNNFTGSLPISIGTLSDLESLNLRNNRLSGVIPASFQNCSNLIALDMGENEFVGNIPTWMGESFSRLKILNLRSNKFQGVFPIQLCRLASLHILDVAYNTLSGTIPRCINNFTAMATTNDSSDDNALIYIVISVYDNIIEDASIVTKGSMAEYNSILNLVRIIDISMNNFSGEIPAEVTSLRGLQSLNLSHNFFTGKIPKNIGEMKSIESLDFSANQLSGKIPQSMSSLSFLNHLNLSENNLTGKIPSSTQLQSFGASCFAGNDLCGPPLPDCTFVPKDQNEIKNEDGDDEVDWWLYVSMSLGFVVGFWCFIGPLLVNKRWRNKYCHFLDGLGDKFGCFLRKYY